MKPRVSIFDFRVSRKTLRRPRKTLPRVLHFTVLVLYFSLFRPLVRWSASTLCSISLFPSFLFAEIAPKLRLNLIKKKETSYSLLRGRNRGVMMLR